MLNFVRQFFNKSVTPNFFFISETNNSLPHCGKRNLWTGKFSRERP